MVQTNFLPHQNFSKCLEEIDALARLSGTSVKFNLTTFHQILKLSMVFSRPDRSRVSKMQKFEFYLLTLSYFSITVITFFEYFDFPSKNIQNFHLLNGCLLRIDFERKLYGLTSRVEDIGMPSQYLGIPRTLILSSFQNR